MAAGLAGRPRAGDVVTDTLSRYGLDVQVPSSPLVKEWVGHEYGDVFRPEDMTFTGLIGTDGSMIDPRPVQARRAGWSVVKCDDEGNVI